MNKKEIGKAKVEYIRVMREILASHLASCRRGYADYDLDAILEEMASDLLPARQILEDIQDFWRVVESEALAALEEAQEDLAQISETRQGLMAKLQTADY